MRCMHLVWKLCMSPSYSYGNYWEYVRMALSKSINLLPFYFATSNFSQVSSSTLNPISFQRSPRGHSCHLLPEWQKQKTEKTVWESLCQSLSVRLRPHAHPILSSPHAPLSQPKDTSGKGQADHDKMWNIAWCPDISLSCLKTASCQRPSGILRILCDPRTMVE